jgi:hypothetical protein
MPHQLRAQNTVQIHSQKPLKEMGICLCLVILYFNLPMRIAIPAQCHRTISKCNQVEILWLYSGYYSGVFVSPKNAQNAETKCQSGALPNSITSHIGFNDKGLHQPWCYAGFEPRRQLLKASVYHSATSDVLFSWVNHFTT